MKLAFYFFHRTYLIIQHSLPVMYRNELMGEVAIQKILSYHETPLIWLKQISAFYHNHTSQIKRIIENIVNKNTSYFKILKYALLHFNSSHCNYLPSHKYS